MEWTLLAGTALGLFFGSAVLLFARSLRRARQGGAAVRERAGADAAYYRTKASDSLVRATAELPGSREEVRRAREAGTLRRTAADILQRQRHAEASARRSAQSYGAFSHQHEELLAFLGSEGALRYRGDGTVELDRSRFPASAQAEVSFLENSLHGLRSYADEGAERGIAGPLSSPVAITEREVRGLNEHLDQRRVDEQGFRNLVRDSALGNNLLAVRGGNREMAAGRAGLIHRLRRRHRSGEARSLRQRT